MYVGAEWFVGILSKLRVRWGITAAFAGTVIAVASTSPEIIMNVTAASMDLGDIGLGNVLGSNILNIPILVLVAYLASKYYHKQTLPADRETVLFHAVPYLGMIGLITLLTLTPGPMEGFQLYDGVILLAAYIIYTYFAIKKGKGEGKEIHIPKEMIYKGIAGFLVLAIGAVFAIIASEGLAHELLGDSASGLLIAGLFIAAMASSLPEALASWHAVKTKESIAALTSVIDDNIISITLAIVPLTLVITSIVNPELYIISLTFVLITALEYTIFAYTGYHICFEEVVVLTGTYIVYMFIVLYYFI
jgi:cation:H+ antiporter